MRLFLPDNAAENAQMWNISKDWVAPVALRIYYYQGGVQGKWLLNKRSACATQCQYYGKYATMTL